jgi:hypothetical protein
MSHVNRFPRSHIPSNQECGAAIDVCLLMQGDASEANMKQRLRFAVVCAFLVVAPAALAAFHLYQIEELFSDATGTVQYVVMHEASAVNGENFWAGRSISSTSQGVTKSFTFPSNLPRSTTANTRVLIATVGFAQLNLITPDFVVPNGFLPLVGGTVNYAGVDQVSYGALPTDGTSALNRNGSTIPNVATNFAGQTASVAAAPPPAAINFQGLWWAAPANSESGWGLNVAHQADTIFASWFTYDTTARGWWLVMTAQKSAANTYTGTFYQTRGPAFTADPFNPQLVTPTAVGTGTLTFTDANNGAFSYIVNGIAQTKNITREVFGPLPTCTFGSQPNFALATNYQDLWWNAPAASESGWGINLNHQGDTIFATWFTYDLNGSPLWLVVTAIKTGSGVYSGDLYRTAGARFDAFNPANVVPTKVGTATFTFANGNSATFSYTVQVAGMSSPETQTKTITREIFAPPEGTLCQ